MAMAVSYNQILKFQDLKLSCKMINNIKDLYIDLISAPNEVKLACGTN